MPNLEQNIVTSILLRELCKISLNNSKTLNLYIMAYGEDLVKNKFIYGLNPETNFYMSLNIENISNIEIDAAKPFKGEPKKFIVTKDYIISKSYEDLVDTIPHSIFSPK